MNYNKVLNWKNIGKQDKKSALLKSELTKNYLKKFQQSKKDFFNEGIYHWRNKILDKFEIFQGKELNGNILEVGAGTAISSGYASKFKKVKKVFSLDSSYHAVYHLMPYVHEKQGANLKKIQRVHGTFNNLTKFKIKFNLIWGTGAFHNSKDLSKTFLECFKKLNDGGYLLISDMCEQDFFTNHYFKKKNLSIVPNSKDKYNKIVSFKDTSDFFRPLNEYLYLAKKNGFEVAPYIFSEKFGIPANDDIFHHKNIYFNYQLKVFNPYFKRIDGLYDSMLLICKKNKKTKRDVELVFSDKPKFIYFNFYISNFYKNKLKLFFFRIKRKIKMLTKMN